MRDEHDYHRSINPFRQVSPPEDGLKDYARMELALDHTAARSSLIRDTSLQSGCPVDIGYTYESEL